MFHHKKKKINPFLLALFSSLFIHFALLFPLLRSVSLDSREKYNENNLVFVEYPVHQQIVNQQNFNDTLPKKTTIYLSKLNKSVEKETQAMLKGLFHQAEIKSLSYIEQNLSSASKKSFPSRKISSLEPNLLKKINTPLQIDIENIYRPHFFQKEKQHKASRTMDFLPGIEFGSHTLLNTKEFAYYSYFSRMKEQLYWRWIQYFRTEPQILPFKIISSGNRQRLFSTSIYVYLSPEGEIYDMTVVKSSGEESIDSAALHAFLSAAPFPNPPPELVEEDGYIHIKQSFHLYISPSSFEDLFSNRHSENL